MSAGILTNGMPNPGKMNDKSGHSCRCDFSWPFSEFWGARCSRL